VKRARSNAKMAFPNIFENITRDNVVNVTNIKILNIEHTVIILGSLKRELCTFKV